MSDITNQELKELILSLDKKMEVGFTELKGEIKRVETELKGEIKRIDQKFDGVDKRLIAEESLTRSVFIGLFLAVITAGVKYFFFPSSINV
jgi:hypothetical protein